MTKESVEVGAKGVLRCKKTREQKNEKEKALEKEKEKALEKEKEIRLLRVAQNLIGAREKQSSEKRSTIFENQRSSC